MKRIIKLLSASAVMLSAVSCSKSDPAGPGPEPGPVVESPANCYIISKAGDYRIQAVKGNSREPVGEVSAVEVL